jgi:rubrerythrin
MVGYQPADAGALLLYGALQRTGCMNDTKRLQVALGHEEDAIRLYRQYEQESQDPRLKEMFGQFAMNETWHAAAIRAKIDDLERLDD